MSPLRIEVPAVYPKGLKRSRDWVVAQQDLWNYFESRTPQGGPGRVAREKQRPRRRAARKGGRNQ